MSYRYSRDRDRRNRDYGRNDRYDERRRRDDNRSHGQTSNRYKRRPDRRSRSPEITLSSSSSSSEDYKRDKNGMIVVEPGVSVTLKASGENYVSTLLTTMVG